MTEDQLKRVIAEVTNEVTNTVRVVVNGKIDGMRAELKEYIVTDTQWKETVETYMAEMRPLKDGVNVIQKLNLFIKWLGFPALGALMAYWFMK